MALTGVQQQTGDRPDLQALISQLRRTRLQLRLSVKTDAVQLAAQQVQVVVQRFENAAGKARIRYLQDTRHRQAEEELSFYQESALALDHHLQQVVGALGSPRFQESLGEQLGPDCPALLQAYGRTHGSQIRQDRLHESQLMQRYVKQLSTVSVFWQQSNQASAMVCSATQNPDRALRRASWLALARARTQQLGELDDCFDALIACRHRMAQRAGYDSYLQLAADRIQRPDLLDGSAQDLHRELTRYLLAPSRQLRQLQRKNLKLDQLTPYDACNFLPEGNPLSGGLAWTELAQALDQGLSTLLPDSGFSAQALFQQGRLDRSARLGKAPWPACFVLPEESSSVLLMQETRTFSDLVTFLLLTGQALGWHMLQGQPLRLTPFFPDPGSRIFWGEAFALLVFPQLKGFLDVHYHDSGALLLIRHLLKLLADTRLDVFEHALYSRPDMTAQARNQLWLELTASYQPDLDLSEDPFLQSGRGWQLAERLALQPLSAGSSLHAQLAALDLWRQSVKDAAPAAKRYQAWSLASASAPFSVAQETDPGDSLFGSDRLKAVAYTLCDSLSL